MSSYQRKFEKAAEAQGFEDPLDESPVDVPDPFDGGGVRQTGGFVLNREWRTYDIGEFDNHLEFLVVYGEQDAVSLNAMRWDHELPGYVFDSEVETKHPEENTDEAKAELAAELMSGWLDDDEFDQAVFEHLREQGEDDIAVMAKDFAASMGCMGPSDVATEIGVPTREESVARVAEEHEVYFRDVYKPQILDAQEDA